MALPLPSSICSNSPDCTTAVSCFLTVRLQEGQKLYSLLKAVCNYLATPEFTALINFSLVPHIRGKSEVGGSSAPDDTSLLPESRVSLWWVSTTPWRNPASDLMVGTPSNSFIRQPLGGQAVGSSTIRQSGTQHWCRQAGRQASHFLFSI